MAKKWHEWQKKLCFFLPGKMKGIHTMRIALADDAAIDRSLLTNIIKQAALSCRCLADVDVFEDGNDLLAAFHPYAYSLIFLDIYMEGLNGIDTAKKIREKDPDVKIVFVTTSTDHMPEAFDVHAYQYLPKTAGGKQMKEKVESLLTELQREMSADPAAFHFISDRQEVSLPHSAILCVESGGHYTFVTDRQFKKYRSRMTFSEIEEILSRDKRFLTINRGILVNMDFIRSFEKGICTLTNDLSFAINIKKSKELNEQRQKYLLSRAHDDRNAKRGKSHDE